MSLSPDEQPPLPYGHPGSFADTGFGVRFLVVCPRCAQCAKAEDLRLTCTACGLVNHATRCAGQTAEPVDWLFGLPLWLQAPCAGHILWAHNFEHLLKMEQYIGTWLRERWRYRVFNWGRRGAVRRLPGWMIRAKNREAVLRAIAELKSRM